MKKVILALTIAAAIAASSSPAMAGRIVVRERVAVVNNAPVAYFRPPVYRTRLAAYRYPAYYRWGYPQRGYYSFYRARN